MELNTLQFQHRNWLRANFPNQAPEEPLMGVVEEVGELSHAMLKRKQGIRGYDDDAKFEAEVKDAVGDIVIYLSSLCTSLNIDFADAVRATWQKVKERDWQADPVGAGDE